VCVFVLYGCVYVESVLLCLFSDDIDITTGTERLREDGEKGVCVCVSVCVCVCVCVSAFVNERLSPSVYRATLGLLDASNIK